MKQNGMASAVLITLPLFFLIAFSACAELEPADDKVSATIAEEIAPADAIGTAEVAETTGLDIVMDGSSLEAYEKSLEKVRETGSEDEYQGLKGAFEYLLLYDLGAKHSPEKLAARLHGKTGHEILSLVKW